MMNAITDFDFEKLQALVDKWVVRYNHIAEITFFQVDDTKQPLGIELVLCDPPKIAPKWRPLTIKDGFIKYGPESLKEEVINTVYPVVIARKVKHPSGNFVDYKDQAKKQKAYAENWVVVIRWETDPSYFEHISTDNTKMLYSAPTVDSIDGIFKKFSAEDYEHFSRLSYFTEKECLDLLIGFPFSEKDILNPRVRLSKEAREKKDEARKWIKNWSTNFDRTKEILNRAIENDELELLLRNKGILAIDAGPFLKWAREKGFHIPIDNIKLVDNGKKTENQKDESSDLKEDSGTLPRTMSPDVFVKTITIRYENDSQITIQEKGKRKIPVPFEQLGYREAGIEWNNFLKVLKSPPDHHWRCPEDRNRQQLRKTNKRLIEWFRKELKIPFPDNHKLYERVKNKGKGIYRFIFKVEYPDTIPICQTTKNSFNKKFNSLLERYKNEKKESLLENIREMANEGFSKKFLTEEEVRAALQPERSIVNPESEFHNTPGYSIKK